MSTEDKAGGPDQAATMTPHGASRRRLAKAGLGAAGVLWTTQAHATRMCLSPSAALASASSGLDSNKPGEARLSCIGRSPGYWKNHGGWPVPPETRFGSIFPCAAHNANTYAPATLQSLIEGAKFDKQNFGMHIVASYLNVKSGWIGYISEETLLRMWRELQSTGHYQPAKNAYWDVETTKHYLESTYS